jgi:23S rRNA (cytidine2498-2'-O)-methyltransferase
MPVTIEHLSGTAFLAFPDMANLLQSELAGRFAYGSVIPAPTVSGTSFSAEKAQWYGDLLYCPDFIPETDPHTNAPAVPYWARTAMLKPFIIHFDSIGEAA